MKRVENLEAEAQRKVDGVKIKYKDYISNLKKELKVSNKVNERLNQYIESLKKELVFAKIIIKNPKKMKKATNLMNFSIYKVNTSPDTTRSHHSVQRSSHVLNSSRKLLAKTPNESFQF